MTIRPYPAMNRRANFKPSLTGRRGCQFFPLNRHRITSMCNIGLPVLLFCLKPLQWPFQNNDQLNQSGNLPATSNWRNANCFPPKFSKLIQKMMQWLSFDTTPDRFFGNHFSVGSGNNSITNCYRQVFSQLHYSPFTDSHRSSATSTTFTSRSPRLALMPSSSIVMQNGQPTATTSAPVSNACRARS